MGDDVESFVHDHARLNVLVSRVRDRLAAGSPGEHDPSAADWDELAGRVQELEDVLFGHFAREEEALFPFLLEAVPEIREAVTELMAAHDRICKALLTVSSALAGEPRPAWSSLLEGYERFLESYTGHSRREHELFDSLGTRLSAEQASALRDLLRGI